MASGAEGLAGLSAPSGGAGAVAQPAKTPAAINVIERRFIIRFGDEILETVLDFHWAEIPDVLRAHLPERYRLRFRCREWADGSLPDPPPAAGRGLELGDVIQGHPSGQRVHIVSPMYDLSFLNSDDGDEPIVVRRTRRKYLSVNFVFEDHNATIF